MNAALRGATRMALDRGADIYAVCEGYDGLVEVRAGFGVCIVAHAA